MRSLPWSKPIRCDHTCQRTMRDEAMTGGVMHLHA
ncbi:hypothetical protein YSA_03602 [Pseudomonas putida ND6]|uniref:Uncharacterized protein n=1 Tax=Pseudomonas putida ND6 TaxID=231023 RepID=I3UT90_PSEPU|nr:hypothetical protein YSA_03602 [Pseudomonas putida ND6]